MSRNQKDLGKKFPTIAEAIAKLGVQDAIIDGEIVALDEQGRSSFQLLQGQGDLRPISPLLKRSGHSTYPETWKVVAQLRAYGRWDTYQRPGPAGWEQKGED